MIQLVKFHFEARYKFLLSSKKVIFLLMQWKLIMKWRIDVFPEMHSTWNWNFGKTENRKTAASIFFLSEIHNVQSAKKLLDSPRPSNNVEILWLVVVKEGSLECRFSMSIWSPACGTTHIKMYIHVRSKYTDLRSVKISYTTVDCLFTSTTTAV